MSPRKQGWTGGGVRGCYSGPGHLLKSPSSNLRQGGGADWSRGSTSSFQRLQLTDVLAGARPPRLPSWDHRPRKALGAFPDSYNRAFLLGVPRPDRLKGVQGGSTRSLVSVQALRRLLVPAFCCMAGETAVVPGTGALAAGSAEDPGSTLCHPVWGVSLPLCKVGASQDEEEPARAYSPPRQ